MKGGGKDGTQSMLQNMMQRECKEKHHCEWMLSVKGNCNVPVQCLYIQHKHQDQRDIYCCTFFTPDQCRTVTSDIKATTFIKEKQECDVCSLGSIFFSQGCRWERVGSRSRHAMFPASIQSRREKNSRWWQSFQFPIYFFHKFDLVLTHATHEQGARVQRVPSLILSSPSPNHPYNTHCIKYKAWNYYMGRHPKLPF